MQKTKEILNWHFNFNDFKYTTEHLFTNNTKDTVNKSLAKLDKIAINSDGQRLPDKRLIEDIYYNFQANKHKNHKYLLSLFSNRDVRILVWALDYSGKTKAESILLSKELSVALKLILDKWRSSYIIGLWHILLRNWTDLDKEKQQFKLLKSVIENKGNNYSGKRNDILKITSNLNLFLANNPTKSYAEKLLEEQIPINKAHTLINQKESILSYSYFSKVAKKYVKQLSTNQFNDEALIDVYEFLEKHNSKQVTLIVCSSIINNGAFDKFENTLKKYSVKMIGDPVQSFLWKSTGLTQTQEQSIESARRKLNTLLNKRLIKVFFEKLVQDYRRKAYWLKFIDRIDDIKFVGNRANYYLLKNIENVSKEVDSRYKTTSRNQGTCALIIYSKDYVFVEFTDTGALYIYKQHNFNINLNNIGGMEDLKMWTSNSFACKNNPNYYSYNYKYLTNKEGRITHQGDWESRVDTWMKKYY